MARFHGRSGRLYMSTSGSGTAVPVASLNNWSLNMATDKAETTSFGDANKTYVQGLPDLSGTFSGFWDDADETVFDASDSTDGVNVYLYPNAPETDEIFWSGPAWVDCSITVSVSGAITISGSLTANGSWSRVWP